MMFPLTFQTENVANMKDEFVVFVKNFIMRNMETTCTEDYVKKHTYCAMVFTGLDCRLSGLVLVRVIKEHFDRQVQELSSLCIELELRGGGVGSQLLQFVNQSLHENDISQLYIDSGPRHDQLLKFHKKNGMKELYSNAHETCMVSRVVRRRSLVQRCGLCFISVFLITMLCALL